MSTIESAAAGTVPEALQKAVSELLRARLKATGVDAVVVHPDSDHAGEPILLAEVKHRWVQRPLDPREIFEADRAARDLAWQMGERRFLHVAHAYDERQQVAVAK